MYSFVVLNCLKLARRCERYLKLRRIRTKMAVRLKWEELSGRKVAETVQRGYAALSCASRRLPMSRGHKLTLGTNARESRLARRRRRRPHGAQLRRQWRIEPISLLAGGITRVFGPRRRAVLKKKVNRAGFDTVYSGRNFPEVIEERVDYTFKGDDEGVVFL